MKIEFLNENKESATIRFENEDSTFASVLKDELWKTKGVDATALDKRHPLTGRPELTIQAKEPRKLLKTAAQNIKKNVEEFEKEILRQM